MTRGLYRGYSSFEFQRKKTFKIYDVELVKMDLINHIFTMKGSRLMMPKFGTIIPELVFEPLNEDVVDLVYEELEFVFNYDPRVETIQLQVVPDYDRSRITCVANLRYIELAIVDAFEFNIEFES